jgi:leucyl aminopeptidase
MSMIFAPLSSENRPYIQPAYLKDWGSISSKLHPHQQTMLKAQGFEPKAGSHTLLYDEKGSLEGVLFFEDETDPWAFGALVKALPVHTYRLKGELSHAPIALLSWLLAGYSYDRFKDARKPIASLEEPAGVDCASIMQQASATVLARDLINAPANVMGPAELEAQALILAAKHDAKCLSIVAEDLLEHNFPLIHIVGQASTRPPRLVQLEWGKSTDPKITLVGKGICYDTGGLDIKPSSAMAIMKKDMGGAATVMALAEMLMAAKCPVRLRVLLPIAENSIAGNAFRTGDVYRSRKGLSVEIGNTDAEGRLVLADALALSGEEETDLTMTFATLTGAARVAVGPDLVPFYTRDDDVQNALMQTASQTHDPLWPMPLWKPYEKWLESKIADLNSAPSQPFAGSVTAALFLEKFVSNTKTYVHFDLYAWNMRMRAGRPEGGELQAARAVFAYIMRRYGQEA